jgi:hypothetical protein
MYLTREANLTTLRGLAALAPGSVVAMTFLLPLDLVDERDSPTAGACRPGRISWSPPGSENPLRPIAPLSGD